MIAQPSECARSHRPLRFKWRVRSPFLKFENRLQLIFEKRKSKRPSAASLCPCLVPGPSSPVTGALLAARASCVPCLFLQPLYLQAEGSGPVRSWGGAVGGFWLWPRGGGGSGQAAVLTGSHPARGSPRRRTSCLCDVGRGLVAPSCDGTRLSCRGLCLRQRPRGRPFLPTLASGWGLGEGRWAAEPERARGAARGGRGSRFPACPRAAWGWGRPEPSVAVAPAQPPASFSRRVFAEQ